LVAAKIGVAEGSTSEQVAGAIDAAEKAVRQAEPTASSIYLEPDIYRADYQRAERPASPAPPTHRAPGRPTYARPPLRRPLGVRAAQPLRMGLFWAWNSASVRTPCSLSAARS